MSIPVYTMATFKIFKSVCETIDAIVRRFWWGANPGSNKFLALESWDSICLNKIERGLGFKKYHNFNLAMLAKLGWMMAARKERPWVQVMSSRYLKDKSFFGYEPKKGDSRVWKGILSTRDIIRRESCYRIGNGRLIDACNVLGCPGLGIKPYSSSRKGNNWLSEGGSLYG